MLFVEIVKKSDSCLEMYSVWDFVFLRVVLLWWVARLIWLGGCCLICCVMSRCYFLRGQGCFGCMPLFGEVVKKFDILLEWLLFVLILFFLF